MAVDVHLGLDGQREEVVSPEPRSGGRSVIWWKLEPWGVVFLMGQEPVKEASVNIDTSLDKEGRGDTLASPFLLPSSLLLILPVGPTQPETK